MNMNTEKIDIYGVIYFFLLFLIAVLPYYYLVSPGYFSIHGRDTHVFLDGIYRVYNGQIPHVDFESQLGSLFFSLPAFLANITKGVWAAIPLFLVFITVFINICIFLLFHPNVKEIPLFLGFSLLLVIIAISPIRSGEILNITWHKIYSDVANSLLCLIIAYCGLKIYINQSERRSIFFEAIAVGSIFFFLFFISFVQGENYTI